MLIRKSDCVSKFISNEPNYLSALEELKKILRTLLIIENKLSYEEIYKFTNIPEIKRTYVYPMRTLQDNIKKYIYYSDNIPFLTNSIIMSAYIDNIFGYHSLVDDEKRNFIKNILLKEFYEQHSVLMYQLIFNIWNVVDDYKKFENNLIKLNHDGTLSDLPDFDERFP